MADRTARILPGFRLSLSYSVTYLTILVLIPHRGLLCQGEYADVGAPFGEPSGPSGPEPPTRSRSARHSRRRWWPSALGLLIAWVLVRYEFPFKRLFDSLIDLPLALPTAVAGLVYSSLYVENGWLGQFLVPLGIEGAYSRLAIVLVLTFIGVAVDGADDSAGAGRPSMTEIEEAAACLGANRLQTFRRVILPTLYPAMVTGFALAFARALGEYGSVVFVSGNMPYKTEIAPVLIVARLEEFAYGEATAIAVVLLVMSFSMLVIINLLERWSNRYGTLRHRWTPAACRSDRQRGRIPGWSAGG